MASRGARARKVTTKEIEKVAGKSIDKERAERFAKLHSPTPNARPASPSSFQPSWTKRQPVLSSNVSVTSGESNGSSSRFSSVVASKISSKISSNGLADERKVFVSKGDKVTAHPRGRGGGVPTNLENAKGGMRNSSRNNHSFQGGRSHSISSRSQATILSSNHDKSWADTKIWVGHGQAPKPYRGFEHDDDMWQADGNCLIFFSEETDEEDPRPMLRVHTSMLEQARSTFMINLLKYGEIVPEEEQFTPPPRQNTAQHSQWPLNSASLGNLDELLSENRRPGGYSDDLRPPQTPNLRSSSRDTWSTSDQTMWSPGGNHPTGGVRGPATVAESVTAAGSDVGDTPQNPPGPLGPVEITHEIWFRAPSHIKRTDIQRRHHMATRNYLALLYGLPIIGNDFYEMLSDLQNVMDTYYELNEPSERWNSAQVLVQFVTQMQLDDVRGDIKHALGLLAWSEQSNVMWDAGYLEGFVHCVGMMTQETLKMREYRSLSQISRHKLQNANNAMQLRLIEAEERLARFDFPEMWYIDGVSNSHPAQKSFEAFREFLFSFYEAEYGQWPPRHEDHQGHWLGRNLMGRLQADFGAIYQYWVDREISWDANEERHTRKWEMAPTRLRAGGFEADSPGLPITDMLIGFDSSQKFDHIPHPYPLLPTTRSPSPNMKSARKSIFSKFKPSKERTKPDVKSQYQMALAFNTASNINRLGTSFEDNKIIDEIGAYEKSFQMPGVQPFEARLGRWILLYGILQVLSTVSVDTGGLKYKEKIKYFVSPSLEGCPPWRSLEAAPLMIDACQQRSYCWQAPQSWGENGSALSPPGYSNHQYELSEPATSPIELDSRTLQRNRSLISMNDSAGGVRSPMSPGLLRSPTISNQLPRPINGEVSSPRLAPSRSGTLRLTPVLMGQAGRDLKPDIPARDERRVSPMRRDTVSNRPDARNEGFYNDAR